VLWVSFTLRLNAGLAKAENWLPAVSAANHVHEAPFAASFARNETMWNDFLSAVRHQALQFANNLPDFLCTQTTQRYSDSTGSGQWQLEDTLEAELSFSEKRESYGKVRVNGRPSAKRFESIGGTVSIGEFGSILRTLFAPESQARFWVESMEDQGTAVIGFTVPQADSGWTLSFKNSHSLKVAYRGQIWVDTESRKTLRVTQEAQNLPPTFPIVYARTTAKYGLISVPAISSQTFLLPHEAEVILEERRSRHITRNRIEFRNYRKFTSDVRLIPD
jgi:hypothetical protein